MDFLLVLTGFFSLGVTVEALRAIIGSKSAILLQRGPVDPKFQVKGVAPTNHSFAWYKIWRDFSYVLSQCTRLTDRRTDKIPIARPRLHSCTT